MNEPIRILQHVRVLDSGGIEAFIFANLRKMDRNKVNFDFLVTRDQPEFYDEELKKLGCKKIVLKYKKYKNSILNPLSQAVALYKFCNENKEKYPIIHFQSIGANGFLNIIAARMAGIPCRIAHSHIANDIKPQHNSKSEKIGKLRKKVVLARQSIIRKMVTKFSTHYFGCSKMACEWMFTKKANAKKECIVINNPIDTSKFIFNEEIRNKYRQKLKIQDKFVIGHVGRFVYSKNHQFLLEVFSNVLKKEPNAVLLLIGEGKLKNSIERQVEELKLKDKVIFYGETDKVNETYNAFDYFVFPSHYEGLGIVLIEAQTNGMPIIASSKIPEEVNITDNFTFYSLEKTPEEWANKILEGRKNRNANNYKKVIDKGYDINYVSQKLQNTYVDMFNSII